ncbi:SIMPL domain-containing protein [Streptomyces sp. NPDC059740]|uniref:SIMPL domain-containing protein n=1 Tax=Streptomyces sp. NPDC059740 TaxID=3346926 RepID=UPI00366720D3
MPHALRLRQRRPQHPLSGSTARPTTSQPYRNTPGPAASAAACCKDRNSATETVSVPASRRIRNCAIRARNPSTPAATSSTHPNKTAMTTPEKSSTDPETLSTAPATPRDYRLPGRQPPHPRETTMTDTAPQAPPHGTPDAPHLTVRGHARIEADPDTACIRITVTARNADRTAALADLTRRNDRVRALVTSHGTAVTALETGALALTPELSERSRGERVRAHHGRVHLTAQLTDFTALAELAARLGDEDLTEVAGPWWTLRPDNPAHRAAREQAVHDALTRAREYAHALGGDLAALLELTDTEGGIHAYGTPPPGGLTRSAAPAPLVLEPERQEVHATVTARFTMTRPRL